MGVLYHGSTLGNIEVLEPKQTSLSEQPVVFAGSLWVALCYTGLWTDEEINQGTVNGVPHLEEMVPHAFHKVFNKGGYVYTLDDSSFVRIDSTAEFEWVSYQPVKVKKVRFVKNPIAELQKEGVVLKRHKG